MNDDELFEGMKEGFAIRLADLEKKLDAARSALRIISTWATFEYGPDHPVGHALVSSHVENLCEETLAEIS